MEDLYEVRLEVIRCQVEKQKQVCVDLFEDMKVGRSTSNDVSIALRILNCKKDRYALEISSFLQNGKDRSVGLIHKHTTMQLEIDAFLTKIDYQLSSHNIPVSNNVTSKLPQLELLKFKGDILKWYEFWDRFSASVDCKPIRKVDKLSYLMACMQGEAKDALEGLETTDSNYDIAVATLRDRFGRKNIVVDAHYRELYRMTRKNDTVRECRRILNEMERHLRVLHSFGENINGAHLRCLLLDKFPEEIMREIKLRVTDDIDIAGIRKIIDHIISARECVSEEMTQPSYSTEILHIHEKRNKARSFTTQLNTSKKNPRKLIRKSDFDTKSAPVNKKPKRMCIFCDQNHFNDECRKYFTLSARKGKLFNRCYICFGLNHTANECKVSRKCAHCEETGKHNRALCPKKFSRADETTTNMVKSYPSTILQTATVFIKGREGSQHKARLLLDSGSQRSYITKQLAQILSLKKTNNDSLLVYTFGQNEPKKFESPRVVMEIFTPTGSLIVIYANVVPFISDNVFQSPYRLNNLNIELADDGTRKGCVDVLIGNDYYFSIIKEGKIALDHNLYLIETLFGWVWSGGIISNNEEHTLSAATFIDTYLPDNLGFTSPDLPLRDNVLKRLWDLESIGIKDSPKSQSEEEAVQYFNDTVTYDGQRYYVKWPWIQYPPHLPTNYGLSWGRLNSLLKRNSLETLSAYNTIIEEQSVAGVIEKVENYLQSLNHPVHYLPHHLVVRKDDPMKLRIVYDASAKTNSSSLSLNECLYKGPLMLEDLTGLLLKFRQRKIGLIADVEKAFLQVALNKDDRDVTRFLWTKNIEEELSQDNVICYRFCRVPFGIISSPFLLNATIRYHLTNFNDPVLDSISRKIYVDNIVTSVDSEAEAKEVFKNLYSALQEISMNTRQWNSNSSNFLKIVPEVLREHRDITKVLGMLWDTKRDKLMVKINIQQTDSKLVTKRLVLKSLASIYDPCGFLAPVVLPAKLFIQHLWSLKIDWDSKLSEEMSNNWFKIQNEIVENKGEEFCRYTGTDEEAESYELHCFTDSSNKAYAAVVYLRSQSKHEVKVSFLMSKSRVVPLKDKNNLQIPKLELLGCLIGSRLLNYVKNNSELSISKQFLWTDSQVVISWIHSSKLLPPFVSRRIEEIKSRSEVKILYVSSNDNPADIATRNESFTRKNLWFGGPVFLRSASINYAGNWATAQSFCVLEDPEETEVRDDNLKENTEQNSKQDESSIEDAEPTIDNVRKDQKFYYPQESDGKITDITRSLGLFKDEDNLLRCKSRTELADLPYDQKYPILLSRKSTLTSSIIDKIHKANYHVGVGHTLSLVRQKYWIPQGRSAVQRVLNKCFQCQKHGGGPYKLPHMPQLPKERVNYNRAFSFIGLDYLGPLVINNRGEHEKRWICLFTCLAVRAVHLEVVRDLSAEECTLALRRLVATRGTPILIISDNASQFKLTADVVKGNYCITNNIQWKFIPELAPWHGGFYERLVGLVKQCLKRTLDKHMLNENQLQTIIKEVELVLNTRPLTYVNSEICHILKPQDFLCLNECIATTSNEPYDCQGDTETKKCLIESWQRGQKLVEEFSNMFVNQYLMSLRDRKQIFHKQPRITNKRTPTVGDTVQIKGDSHNRNLWKVGNIIEIIRGKDGEVRVATVNVEGKKFVRSIGHLYPLEVEEQLNEDNVQSENIGNDLKSRSSSRAAAVRAKDKIYKWTKELVNLIVTDC